MTIIRLQNPAALDHPAVREVFAAAFGETYDADGTAAALGALVTRVLDPRTGVFVGEENGAFKACVVVTPPTHAKYSAPQVIALYNAGSKSLREAIISQAVEFMRQSGYNRFWCINETGKPNAVYSRWLATVGAAKQIGTILEYRLAA